MTPEAILACVMGALTAMFGWLRVRDRRPVLTAQAKIAKLEEGEKRCRAELGACMTDLDIVRAQIQERETDWNQERTRFQDEITRQERDRHQLTYENNRLLAEKCSLLERLATKGHKS